MASPMNLTTQYLSPPLSTRIVSTGFLTVHVALSLIIRKGEVRTTLQKGGESRIASISEPFDNDNEPEPHRSSNSSSTDPDRSGRSLTVARYKPRATTGSHHQNDSSEEADDDADAASSASGTDSSFGPMDIRAVSAPAANQPRGIPDTAAARVWDKLAQLINRNFIAAAYANARSLGISSAAIQSGTLAYTQRPINPVPATLVPTELQYRVAHDPIIDTIPHARLRSNILAAMLSREIDVSALTKCLRASGAMEHSNGSWQRSGLVVWTFPEDIASWELSEPFIRRWASLLVGCEDLIAVTNAWRSKRGERLFSNPLQRSNTA